MIIKYNKKKIFVSAYACEPNLGSEIGVGWHWVIEMSKYFDLWVLTRQSNKESIEEWLKENRLVNCPTFIYYDLPKKLRFWKKGLRGVRTYYMMWQSLTNKIVERTMKENGIDIYHLLTYGNALWPVSSYGQKQMFIWGPTSAGTYIDADFTKHYGFKSRMKEWMQRTMAKTLVVNQGFKKRCRNANLILCKTEDTLNSIPCLDKDKAIVFTDVAINLFDASKYKRDHASGGVIRYLAVGRLDAWRGFDLMLEAFAVALKTNPNLHLDILGKGTDKDRLESIILAHGLKDKAVLRGQVTMEEYYFYMAACDVVVNPTLKEGAVTTAFDSMSFAKPLICIDSGGYTRYFNNEYAVILPRKNREETIDGLTEGMIRLTDPYLRKEMSKKIITVRDRFTWERKGEQIKDVILEMIQKNGR